MYVLSTKQLAKNKTDAKQPGSIFDKVKWVFIFLVILGAVVANVYYSQQFPLPVRASIFIILIILMLLVAVTTKSGKSAWTFTRDARQEMRKVAWPTRQETVQTTLLIIVVVLLAALFLWVFDSLFVYLIRSILSI
jgi:preprotein translocase subunit SecE